MRVRVVQTVVVGDFYRRALRHHFGQTGLATRDEVRRWVEANGTSGDDDLAADYDAHLAREEAEREHEARARGERD